MESDTNPKLSAGNLEVRLNPSIGGSISAFEWVGEDYVRTPLLRGCNSCSKNVLEAANFPLVPFVNRIRGGRFTFRGREVVLRPNMAGDPSPLHGQGWLAAWRVLSASDSAAELAYEHPPGEWPWAYEARQRFLLDDRGLTLRLACLNLSAEPMPCGLGQHPYFPCSAETRIDAKASHVWTIDEHVLPLMKIAATGRYDLTDRMVCGQDLDHGFGGWSGRARMHDPGWPAAIALSSPDANFFQLYSPVDGGLFVAEPVTHANAALNAPEEEWAELGLRVLEPGEEMSLTMRLEIQPVMPARPNPR
jgi:aldose 1-epimerase